MRQFYNRIPRYVVFDPKGDFPEAGETVIRSPRDIRWRRFPAGWLEGFIGGTIAIAAAVAVFFWAGRKRSRWWAALGVLLSAAAIALYCCSLPLSRILYRPEPRYQPFMDLRLRELFYKARSLKNQARRKGLKQSPYHFRVGVDEGLFQSKAFGNSRPRWLMSAAITGRSLDLGLDLNSQRPAGIPVEIRSEAWRMYVFYLGDSEDMKAVLRYAQGTLTVNDLMDLGEDFSFIEVKRTPGGRRTATKFPPARLTQIA